MRPAKYSRSDNRSYMNDSLLKTWQTSPMVARVGPFVVFVALTALQGQLGEASRYWIYGVKTLVGAALLWMVWPWVQEMRWRGSWEAVAVGIGVWAIWVGLDGLYPSLDAAARSLLSPVAKPLGLEQWCASAPVPPKPWNPHEQFSPGIAWMIVVTRLFGSTLVVPPLEEVFYRSFLYRYIAKPDFQTVGLKYFGWLPFLVTAGIFGLAHYEWLPGILCGMLYQALVLRHNRLGDAMTAHAITNFLLGVWVIWKGAWHFW